MCSFSEFRQALNRKTKSCYGELRAKIVQVIDVDHRTDEKSMCALI